LVSATALAVGLALIVPAAGLADVHFTRPVPLPGSPPKGDLPGPEPSIAFDPAGNGRLYVTAPNSGAVGGVDFWASADRGRTFPIHKNLGSVIGGEDSDVEVANDHTVYVADLEIASEAVCRSHDFGKTFTDGCEQGTATDQAGFDSDREWLTHDPRHSNVLYLAYHDLATNLPEIWKSTDGGSSFSPCGAIINPTSPAFTMFQGTTLVSKPAVAPDGTIYVEFGEPEQSAIPAGPPITHLYMAVADGGCTASTVFTDHLIYKGTPQASLANIFNGMALGPDGGLYVVASGTLDGHSPYNAYVFASSDGGKTWSGPRQVNPPGQEATVLPAVTAGLGRGTVGVGWYATRTSKDPNNPKDDWRYYAAVSTDRGRTFARARIGKRYLHHGDVCVQGIFCSPTANRNLADFSSIGTDPRTGCMMLAIPADPYDTSAGEDPASAFFSRQVRGCVR
jgi:hypothetical protein